MEKRERARFSKRMTCELTLPDGARSTGVVRDVSYHGLFVQTGANPEPNSVVEIAFPSLPDAPVGRFEAGVARKRRVPRQLAASVPSGLGLEIIPPRTSFEQFVDRAVAMSPCPSAEDDSLMAAQQGMKTFRLRLTRHDRPEAQVMTIRCETEASARARALARAGRNWMVANVTRV